MLGFLSDGLDFLMYIAGFGLGLVFAFYDLLAKVLPDVLIFSDTNGTLHNLLLAAGWFGLYGIVGFVTYKLIMKLQESFNEKTESNHDCTLFPMWQVFCYLAAILLPILRSYFDWNIFFLLLLVPLLMAPIVYMVIKAGGGFIFVLLRQILIFVLFVIWAFFFLPFAIIAFAILIFALLSSSANLFGTHGGAVCPQCGGRMSKGETCSCGYSIGV